MKYKIISTNAKISKFWRKVYCNYNNTYTAFRDVILILDAYNIERKIIKYQNSFYIYVPPLLEKKAKKEIAEFLNENNIIKHNSLNYTFKYSIISVFIVCLLLSFYWITINWCYKIFKIAPRDWWIKAGSLDSIKLELYNQWYRLATALTLHDNISHLFGNIVFGSFFLFLLSRRVGYGIAFFISIFGGIVGNLCSIFLHHTPIISIGYSTSLFATIGTLYVCQIESFYNKKSIFNVAAALALLALLGTDGNKTNYEAHFSGLMVGILIGLIIRPLSKFFYSTAAQVISALTGVLILISAWFCAIG